MIKQCFSYFKSISLHIIYNPNMYDNNQIIIHIQVIRVFISYMLWVEFELSLFLRVNQTLSGLLHMPWIEPGFSVFIKTSFMH